ncbi:MAG TPA: flagellar biosynthetic protein FliQ [Candidatus Synoicihabitans sp.]|nr:flagellar biosynthetic protein FliQ [Candidatus Synoicihabitans sp.]
MNAEAALDLFKSVVWFAVYIISPFLLLMLLIGLVTSLIQSVTSIQEQTLTFAPKLFGLATLLVVLSPWLLRSVSEFAVTCFTRMSTLTP